MSMKPARNYTLRQARTSTAQPRLPLFQGPGAAPPLSGPNGERAQLDCPAYRGLEKKHSRNPSECKTARETGSQPRDAPEPNLTNIDMLNCPPILTALNGQIFPNLIEIDINVSEDRIPLLLSFLHSCPRIETITIHHPPLTDTTVLPTRLPPGTIPRLKSFTGPPALAGLLSADRPVVSMELRDHRYALLASTIDTLVHTLHEISGGSVPLRSLNIWRDIPPSGVVVVFDAIYTLFPALRDLTVELLDTWLDDALADGDGYGRWVPWVPPTVPTDDSTLEFSDDGTVDYSSSESEISSRHSDAESSSSSQLESEHSDSECSASSDSESEQSDSVSTQSNADSKGSAVPPPLIPGYMYDDGGLPTPPTSYPNPPADVDKSLQLFMRSLSTAEFTLPHDLEVLRFDQQPPSHLPSPFPDADQHGAVLLLERLLPCIREIRFFRVGEYWERRGGVWTRDYPDNGVSRGGGLVKIVSLVWGEDGRWLDD
ncbi:hypothetical protein C8R43DRAFT_1110320 [Mycena crocata]|nr:hypothetical protein C8R43DRAFT_1110320 [Mycena crocata]